MIPRAGLSLIRVLVVGACALAVVGFAGCGGDSSGKYSEADLQAARKEGAAQQKLKDVQVQQAADQKRLEKELAELKKEKKSGGSKKSSDSSSGSSSGGGGGGTSGGATASSGSSCGDGVSISGPTTCGFAANIASEFRSSGPGVVAAYSPTTGKLYTMSCSASGVCSGGTTSGGSVVYVR